MDVSVEADIKEVSKMLTRLEKKEIPFASSVAINKTAQEVYEATTKSIKTHFDKPVPFTTRAIGVKRSNKRYLKASVFIKDRQYSYLKYGIEGGIRDEGFATLPVNQKTNVYGNIPGLRKKKQYWRVSRTTTKRDFVARIGRTAGVWRRIRGRLRLMVAFASTVRYRSIWPFHLIAKLETGRKFSKNFDDAIRKAIESSNKF